VKRSAILPRMVGHPLDERRAAWGERDSRDSYEGYKALTVNP
jgi:hypothetical protein